jgi:hypothetical protein
VSTLYSASCNPNRDASARASVVFPVPTIPATPINMTTNYENPCSCGNGYVFAGQCGRYATVTVPATESNTVLSMRNGLTDPGTFGPLITEPSAAKMDP